MANENTGTRTFMIRFSVMVSSASHSGKASALR